MVGIEGRYITEEDTRRLAEVGSSGQILLAEKTTTRGILVRRMTREGKPQDNAIYLVTGAKVSGTVHIDYVHVRELVLENGKYRISDISARTILDPRDEVLIVGKINALDPNNKEFFAPLGTGY